MNKMLLKTESISVKDSMMVAFALLILLLLLLLVAEDELLLLALSARVLRGS